jgi:hypothetical protein
MEAPMKFMPCKLALSAGLALAIWQPAAFAQSSPATLFDEHVAAGLPQAFSLPRLADDERGAGVDEVVIEERLDTDVVYPDGSHATTYTGTANGREATFTRIGDELSVSVFDEQAALPAAMQRVRRAIQPEAADAIDVPPALSAVTSSRLTATAPPRELQFWIFLHDLSGESNYAKFHNWYIAWWVRDMERTVKPGIPVKVIIKDHIPGVTDFDYHQGTSVEALAGFRTIATDYLWSIGSVPSQLTKTMLFVDERSANWSGAYGVAIPRNTVAMASGTGPRHIIAHEFGHTLDARHEHAQTRFPCVTNMSGYTVGLYSCRIYSGLNDELIRGHVREMVRLELGE